MFKYYQDSCRTGQRSGTPCTGLEYNLLRLKGLHGIIFGQPPRGYIIHGLEGQGNDKDPGNFGIDQASLDLLTRFYTKRFLRDPSAKTAWICVRALRVNLLARLRLSLMCPRPAWIVFPVMTTTSQKTRLLSQRTELVALLSEAIDDLRNIDCDDLANSLEERMNNILDLSTEQL